MVDEAWICKVNRIDTGMKRKWHKWFWGFFLMLACGNYVSASALPNIAINKNYNSRGVEDPRVRRSQGFYGPDATYNLTPSYTKLDKNGNPLPDSAEFWTMVKDNATGLIWEVKERMDGVMDYANPHDADNRYTWYDSNPKTNGGKAGSKNSHRDTADFLAALNARNYGGYSDWRLPTLKELISLVNHDSFATSINMHFFPNTQAFYYWSSSTADIPYGAWIVDFLSGWDGSYYKGYYFFVRAVRGGR
ncbi:MAG: DUF1566 domain-containing protein [Syntrophales bacterium LBB04]|nr:DUF1566 domain-containing protein [Syntrophales bacterium LBB04]